MPKRRGRHHPLEQLSLRLTAWMGTPVSLITHTLVFTSAFLLILLGVNSDQVMLILITAVSLEAIYLSLLIQMTVNRQAKSLSEVEEEVEDISEDVEDISEDIDKIQAADTA